MAIRHALWRFGWEQLRLQTFDFIIVGAGSAGCVLAERLTRSGKYKVALVEAGGSDNRFWIKVPLGYAKTYDDPAVNWCYTAEPDPGLNGRRAFWPRGRVTGGSSSINAMAYLQGLPHDFDDWEAAGAIGWGWRNVRKTYSDLEVKEPDTGSDLTDTDIAGKVFVGKLDARMHPFSKHFLKAIAQAGWAERQDLNGSEREGVMRLNSTVRKGRRWSAADAFLRPAIKRATLEVISEALVERVLIKEGRAVGVALRQGSELRNIMAAREVILSAGAINSPQLLQLSGLGPAALLKSKGIEVMSDLPQVGQGLQDHLAVSYQFGASEPTLNNLLGNPVGRTLAGIRYLLTKSGPLSVPVNQVSGFVRSDPKRPADIQIYCNPMSYRVRTDGKPDVKPEAGYLISVQPCRPTSRGSVLIASADPNMAPLIQPNSLSTDVDIEMVKAACRIAQRLAATPALRSVTTDGHALSSMTEDALLEDFRLRAGSVYHASCTCRMGNGPEDSVLDSRLRVHGISSLRVIDASSFPNVTSGNTNAPVMMLAARGADMILEDVMDAQRSGGAA